MTLKQIANEGIDSVASVLLNFLPVASPVRDAIKFGVDQTTDLIFDEKKGKEVPLGEHSDIEDLKDKIEPIGLVLLEQAAVFLKDGILSKVDLPGLDGQYEEMFEDGLVLQFKAIIGQLIDKYLIKG